MGPRAWLAVEAPGPDAVAALSLLDPATLSPGGRVDALLALERQAAWLAAMQARVLAVIEPPQVVRRLGLVGPGLRLRAGVDDPDPPPF